MIIDSLSVQPVNISAHIKTLACVRKLLNGKITYSSARCNFLYDAFSFGSTRKYIGAHKNVCVRRKIAQQKDNLLFCWVKDSCWCNFCSQLAVAPNLHLFMWSLCCFALFLVVIKNHRLVLKLISKI